MLKSIGHRVRGWALRRLTWRSLVRLLPIGLLIPFVLCITLFRLRNGEFPSFDETTRYRQIAKGYLDTRENVVIRQGRLRPPGPASIVVFPQDEYLRGIFAGDVLEALEQRRASRGENRLIVLEQANYGVLNPLLGFFFPLRKEFEVSLDLSQESPRIFDAQVLDLDGDGADEVLVTWLEYGGGSGGNLVVGIVASVDGQYQFVDFIPSHRLITPGLLRQLRRGLGETAQLVERLKGMVASESRRQRATQAAAMDPREVLASLEEGLPRQREHLTSDSATFARARLGNPALEILLVPETVSTAVVQNSQREQRMLPWLHTDVFFKFENVDRDEAVEVVAAYPAGDGECHWCPQSWAIVTYQLLGKKLVPDPDLKMIWIPRSRGLGLAAVHGYSGAPSMGEIFPFWAPSWLELPSGAYAAVKARAQSAIVDTVLRAHRR